MKIQNEMYVVIAALALACPSMGQAAQQEAPLSQQSKVEAINALIKDMKENYVFPELADKTAAMLQTHLRQNDYDNLSVGKEFADTVSKQVHEICKDAHLRFRFSATVLPVRKADSVPTADENKSYNHFVKVSNGGYEHVERLAGNLGYLEVRGFPDAEAAKRLAAAAMTFLTDTDALILDLRRNGGGDPEAVRILLSYFFDKKTHINDIYFRDGNRTQEFWTSERVPGKKYLKKDVYVLTSDRTGSGAEECAYDLQSLHRATIIGSSTWGGANPGASFRLSDHFTAFIPAGRAINPYTKTNWEGVGVIPDVRVDAPTALEVAERRALEKLVSEAQGDDKDMYRKALADLTIAKN